MKFYSRCSTFLSKGGNFPTIRKKQSNGQEPTLSHSAWVAEGWDVGLVPASVFTHLSNCYWTCFSSIMPWKAYLNALWKNKKKKEKHSVGPCDAVSVLEGLGEQDVVGSAWRLAAQHFFTLLTLLPGAGSWPHLRGSGRANRDFDSKWTQATE